MQLYLKDFKGETDIELYVNPMEDGQHALMLTVRHFNCGAQMYHRFTDNIVRSLRDIYRECCAKCSAIDQSRVATLMETMLAAVRSGDTSTK